MRREWREEELKRGEDREREERGGKERGTADGVKG